MRPWLAIFGTVGLVVLTVIFIAPSVYLVKVFAWAWFRLRWGWLRRVMNGRIQARFFQAWANANDAVIDWVQAKGEAVRDWGLK